MVQYVAFLRGINVGGRIIRMKDLKTCFESLGFQDVVTYLQSGNVRFNTTKSDLDSLKQRIEERLTTSFHYPAKAQVYLRDSLPGIVNAYPFDITETDFQHYIVFVENNLAKSLSSEAIGLNPQTEVIALAGTVLYWKVKKGMSVKSEFSKYLIKPAYRPYVTTRNINTLQKIVA